jgi:hypothetical protein
MRTGLVTDKTISTRGQTGIPVGRAGGGRGAYVKMSRPEETGSLVGPLTLSVRLTSRRS